MEAYQNATDQALNSGIGQTGKALQSFATAVPGTSVTGPMPTSINDLAVGGATGLTAGKQ